MPVRSGCGRGPRIQARRPALYGDALVIFGITGDLAKKMTLKALYDLCENDTLKVPVIGVGRTDWSDDDLQYRASHRGPDRARQRGGIDEDVFKKFADLLSYVQGDYMDKATYERLKKAPGEAPGLLP